MGDCDSTLPVIFSCAVFRAAPQPTERLEEAMAELPGVRMEVRLPATLFWYKPLCFSYVNAADS